MASSILEAATPGDVEWTPKRAALDPRAFDCGKVGPYSLGPEIRCGPFGPVHLALGAQFQEVLEIERIRIDDFEPAAAAGSLAALVLENLSHCVGLTHPHVACMLGAGLDDGVPYVLRAHVLGRTLADLALDDMRPPPEVAAGILYSVAEGVGFLTERGPRPGVCGLGGLGSDAVLVGWDGSVRLLGAGLSILRDPRADADFDGLRRLARELEPGLGELLSGASDVRDASTQLRRWRREACADRQSRVGSWLRRADADGCDALRRFFSLMPLH